jgi:hemoglobin/transferrin/lactoferrin receptor protein
VRGESRRRGGLLAVLAGGWVAAAAAQTSLPQLEPVEVVGIAHRIARGIDETAASVSVICRDEIERAAAANLREVLRYEPGVSIEASAGRFGLGDIVIRGIGGNRVLTQVDGIRLPDSYRVGRFSSASRNQFDLALLQKIEILRGPGSALYGSDALGGVVALATVDPADFLGTADLGGEAGGGYASAADRFTGSLVLAGEHSSLQALVGYQRSRGHEVDNQGTVDVVGRRRTAPDPQSASNEWLLGKLVWNDRARWRLALERNTQQVRTEVLSLNPLSSRTVELTGDDESERRRASLDADALNVGALARLRGVVYTQRSLTVNDTEDLRAGTTAACLSAPGPISCRRDVRFRFEQKDTGGNVLAEAAGWGYWLFGLETARIQYDESRDGTQTILDTGAVGKVVGGEPMPTRDFPLTTSDRIGAFVQNELRLADGRLDLVPALRLDAFRTRARPDPVFANANPDRPVVDSRDSALSPKLGAVYRVTAATTLTAQLATGFRAPPAADLNLGLSSLPAGYAVVPNPDLRAERSRGAEIGVRGRQPRWHYSATAFVTDYEDLIVSRAPLRCPGEPACVAGAVTTFQSRNIANARIHGFEADAGWRFDAAWSIRGSFSRAYGKDTDRDLPLNTIDPPRAVIGLLYEGEAFGAALHLTHIGEKTRIDRSAGELFASPAVTIVDLNLNWRLGRRLRLSAGVFNLFDRKYWLWADLRNVIDPGVTVDRYTQPGRNASVLLRAGF